MHTFTYLIQAGEKARERGAISESITLFDSALDIAYTDGDKSMARAHLGLAYSKIGEWPLAKQQFELALEYGERSKNKDRIMEATRHLSMCLLHEGKFAQALEKATETLRYAREKGRNDLPWFTHACVKIALKMNITKKQKLDWVKMELTDLVSVWGKEKNKVAKVQWAKGLLKSLIGILFN